MGQNIVEFAVLARSAFPERTGWGDDALQSYSKLDELFWCEARVRTDGLLSLCVFVHFCG